MPELRAGSEALAAGATTFEVLDATGPADGSAEVQLGQLFDGEKSKLRLEHATTLLGFRAGRSGPRLGLGVQHETSWASGPWEGGVEVFALHGRKKGFSPSLQYGVEGHLRRRVTEKGSVFLEAGTEREASLGLKNKTEARLGYARTLVDSERHELEAEVNYGFVRESMRDGEKERFPSPGFALEYAFMPAPYLRFSQKLLADANMLNTRDWDYQSLTELAYSVSKNMALKLAYWVKGRTERVEGFDKTVPRLLFGVEFRY